MSDVENSLFVQHLLEDDDMDDWSAIDAKDCVTSDDDDVISLSDGESDGKQPHARHTRHSDSTLTSSAQKTTAPSLTSSLTASMRVENVGLNVFHNNSPPEYMFSNESLVKYDSIGTLINKLVIKLFRMLHPLMNELKSSYLGHHEVTLCWFQRIHELINLHLL